MATYTTNLNLSKAEVTDEILDTLEANNGNFDILDEAYGNMPTKTSDLTNDSGFVTNAVNNLTNYYLKSQTYTKTEVNNLINAIQKVTIQIVQTLPATGESNVIYFVPKTGSTNDTYDEYIYINNNWEKIGSTDVDLTNYYTKSETDTLLGAKQPTLVSGTNIKTINDQSILGSGNIVIQGGEGTSNYNDLTNKPSINGVTLTGNKTTSDLGITVPTKTSDLTNDSGFITSSYHDSTKQDTLVSGTNIKTVNGTSILGSGNIPISVSASSVSAGTFPGQVVANATAVATLGTSQIRNIYAGTTDMTPGTTALTTGDIYLVYEA